MKRILLIIAGWLCVGIATFGVESYFSHFSNFCYLAMVGLNVVGENFIADNFSLSVDIYVETSCNR